MLEVLSMREKWKPRSFFAMITQTTITWMFMLTVSLIMIPLEVGSQSYRLGMVTNIGGCYGGTVCTLQPAVKLFNFEGYVATTFQGTAFVTMGTSSGTQPLYVGTCDFNGDCGTKVVGTNTYVTIVDGYATFKVSPYFLSSVYCNRNC
jgi:hypothetical protein